MIFGEARAALAIWDRFKDRWTTSKSAPAESITERFIRLFESHGVHRNQIPRFIGHGLALEDVQNEDRLLAALDEPLLEATCERFAVRREWLDGAEEQIFPRHRFYKTPEDFSEFLDKLRSGNPDGEMLGVVVAPGESDWTAEAVLILQEPIGYLGDKPVYRYHMCDTWAFSYWKVRAYLAACVAIAWKRNIYIHGIHMPGQDIMQLAEGHQLPVWGGEGIWALGHKTWDPEYMALQPQAFLDGVDPERDYFGIESGLRLWLELEEMGLMDAGFPCNARPLFEKELAKYRPPTANEE